MCCCLRNDYKEVNVAFVAGQGLVTLVGEHKKILDKLKRNLLEIVGARRIIFEETLMVVPFRRKQMQLV